MDLPTVIQLIGSVGFPIVACIVMGWYVKYTTDKHREELTNLNNQHRDELTSITEALNNNTIALTELKDALIREGIKNEHISN